MNKGKFIVFEGGEGSGKSTMLEKSYEFLISKNIECIKTREPGGINISEQIRTVILDTNNLEMNAKTEALLYAAARCQHLTEKVIPALEAGKHVLCDRFIDSSLAYQGYARNIGIDDIYSINKFAIGDFMPDLSIIFDVDPQVGLDRISKDKNREINRLDKEKLEFHKMVREGYNKVSYMDNRNIIKIDASKGIDEVFNELKDIIIKYIN